MTNGRRSTLVLSAFFAAFVLAAAAPSAAQGEPGVQLTPNGFRMPLFGMSVRPDASGAAVASCEPLNAPQVEAARFGRQVSRAMAISSPRKVVGGPEVGMTFDVTYTDAEGTGFNDAALGATRRLALETALGIWAKAIKAEQPIKVGASMNEIDDGDNNPNTMILALAGPAEFWIIEDTAVPSALAWQKLGARVDNAGPFDINVNVHSKANWDYAVDGKATAPKHSFVWTLLHELAHGLGFVASFDIKTGKVLNDPFPFVYDRFVNRGQGGPNPMMNHSGEEVIRDMKSRDLFFNGESSSELSRSLGINTAMPKLYAPEVHKPASSVSHLDQDTYAPFGTIVMTPLQVSSGDKIDGLTLLIVKDLGWTLMPPPETTAATPERKK